jgi:hypothetical protein
MPRNASGTYSLPVAAYVAGTTIVAANMNSNLSDIGTALTQSLATTGVSAMTGPVKLAAGSAAAPSLTLSSDLTTGWYNHVVGGWTFVSASSPIFALSGSGAALTGSLTVSTSLQVGTSLIVGTTTAMSGILTIAVGSNTAVFRNTTNDAAVNIIVTYQQGSGAGAAATIRASGTAANDIDTIYGYIGSTESYRYTATSFSPAKSLDLREISTPATPGTAVARIFAFDDGANTRLVFQNDAGLYAYIAPAGSIISEAFNSTVVSSALSGSIPADDTIPQTTEGDLILTQAISIKNAGSRIRVRAQGNWGTGTAGVVSFVAAIFDSVTGANAITAKLILTNAGDSGGTVQCWSMEWEYAAPAAGSVTYTLRTGSSNAYRMNGTTAAGRLLGGSQAVTLLIQEIQQ